MLDPQTIEYWPGKKTGDAYHPALWHMLDVCAVAKCLIEKRPVTGNDAWDQGIVQLIALHDLGKISNSFRKQIRGEAGRQVSHAQLSFVLLQHYDELLEEQLGGSPRGRRAFYAAVAGHHGGPPELADGLGTDERRWWNNIGQDAEEVARDVIVALGNLFPGASLEGLSNNDAKVFSWKVSGLTVQADWIGSNSEWFRYQLSDISIASYWEQTLLRANQAVDKAGLHHATPRANATVLSVDYTPRPMQQAVQQIDLPEGPTLVLIEDATGSGKTEAALALASRMMEAQKGDGLYFALPTMATSNAMFARIRSVATELFDGCPSLGLSHGRAEQNPQFQEIRGKDGSDPDEPVTCGNWLADDRRRILLADIGVGTIDQALLAVLPTRFNTLRLWALSSKILIVDEAHSYDPYMGAELCALLKFHAMLGGSVIVMTATLPKAMRAGYAKAFQQGLRMRSNPLQIESDSYPQLTVVGGSQVEIRKPDPIPAVCRKIKAHRVDEAQALELIRAGVKQGAACVWIRNAVDDAIAAVEKLRAKGIASDLLDLLHARFTVADRLDKEKAAQERFGRDGTDRTGRVLVATQVVEASLDLDFDLMISDLAPIGSLIQRAGRLWRHMDQRPEGQRPVPGPALHILSPDPDEVDDDKWLRQVLKAGSWIYPLTDQWRTARAVFGAGEICAPDGLRELIEAVHGQGQEEVPEVLERAESEDMAKPMIERQMAHNQLLKTHQGRVVQDYLAAAQKTRSEEKLATRLGIPQVTLRLANNGARGLEPLANSWETSEVQVSRKRYEKAGRVDQKKPEIAKLKESWPQWKCEAIEIVPVGREGEISEKLQYRADMGLMLLA